MKYLLLLLWLLLAGSVHSAPVEPPPRAHYIVAVDVSADMRGLNNRDAIATAIPKFLFTGPETALDPPLPRFDPARDRLSLVYFALTGAAPTPCKPVTGLDARPPFLFTWQNVPTFAGQAELENLLRGWMQEPCRIVSPPSLSPIVTAEATVAAFVGQQLKDQPLFDQTYLLIATNEAYNRNPARELAFLADRFQVAHTADARALTEQLARYFYIDTPPAWTVAVNSYVPELPLVTGTAIDAISGFPLVLRLAVLRPAAADVDAYLAYTPLIRLDRYASARDQLRLQGEDGPVTLRLLPTDRYAPVSLLLDYRPADGSAAQTTTLDLTTCAEPVCRRDAAGLSVQPLAALGIPDTLALTDPLPTGGTLRFRTLFRHLSAGLYDYTLLRGDWRQLELQTVAPLTVTGTLLFPARTLNNAELAALWQPGDTALSQTEARQRLLAQRAAQEPLYIGTLAAALVTALILLALFLYSRYYHRPFAPSLTWLPLEQATLDFNQLGAHLLLGRLIVSNTARVPWFGRLLGNQDQPRRAATLTLVYPDLTEHHGLILHDAQDIALGLLTGGEGRLLIRELAQEVTDESQFYVFLATSTLADYLCPDPRLDPAEEIVPLSVQLTWKRSRRDAAAPLTAAFNLQLWLLRERAAPPLVHFRLPTEPVHFAVGQSVTLGTFLFQSSASHRYAQPYVGRFDILAQRSGATEEEALALSDNDLIVVHGRETIELDIEIFCDGRRIRYPYPVTDDYSLRLLGDFAPGSQLGPHRLSLHRQLSEPGERTLARERQRREEQAPPSEPALPPPNPFHPGSALAGTEPLPGREPALRALKELIENRSPVVVRGHRRAGKTSLLNALRRQLEGHTLYHTSLEGKPVRNADDLARLLAPGVADAPALRARLAGEAEPVLLLDQIVYLRNADPDVFAWLRDIGQSVAAVVYAGSHWDWVQVVEQAARTPTSSFGNDVSPVDIGPIDPADALRFLVETAPTDVPIAQQRTAGWIVELCGAWPFYLQVMGYAVVQAVREGTRLALVEKRGVIDLYRRKLLHERDFVFRDRWQALPPLAHKALLAARLGRFPDYQALNRSERRAVRDAGLCDADGRWAEDRPFADWIELHREDLGEVRTEPEGT